MERTCNCCQESGEREATVVLFCPKAKSEEKRFRKVCMYKYMPMFRNRHTDPAPGV